MLVFEHEKMTWAALGIKLLSVGKLSSGTPVDMMQKLLY